MCYLKLKRTTLYFFSMRKFSINFVFKRNSLHLVSSQAYDDSISSVSAASIQLRSNRSTNKLKEFDFFGIYWGWAVGLFSMEGRSRRFFYSWVLAHIFPCTGQMLWYKVLSSIPWWPMWKQKMSPNFKTTYEN